MKKYFLFKMLCKFRVFCLFEAKPDIYWPFCREKNAIVRARNKNVAMLTLIFTNANEHFPLSLVQYIHII